MVTRFMIPCLVLLASPAMAAEPIAFAPVAGKSHITFTAVQNHAPVTGEFGDFMAEMHFHPQALEASHVKVTVNTASIKADYDEVESTLRTPDWFNAKEFPKAVFETQSFKALGNDTYEAASTLTIKGHAVPVTLTFTVDEFSDTAAHVAGDTTLKRTDFGIGWEDTSSVEDGVKVHIDIAAKAVAKPDASAQDGDTGADE